MTLTHSRYAYWQLIILAIFSLILAGLFSWYSQTGVEAFVYISMVFYVIATASLFFESFAYKTHKPSARITIAVLGLLLALIMFFDPGDTQLDNPLMSTPLALAGFAFLLNVWALFFMSIFSYWMLKRALAREGEPDSQQNQLQSTLYSKRYLPIGFYSQKQYLFFMSLYLLATIASSVLYYVLQYRLGIHFLISLLTLFASLLPLFILIAFAQMRHLMKPFLHFERTLDYPSFLKVMDRYMANPRIHPETSNFLVLLQANYASNYDQEIAEALWEKVSIPLASHYRLSYDVVYLHRLLWKRDFEAVKRHAESVLGLPLYRKQKMAQKQLTSLLLMNKALNYGTSEQEVEALWPTDYSRKLFTVQNLAFRTLYYHLRDNNEKASTYFQKIQEITPESIGLLHKIELFLNGEKVYNL